MRVRHIAAEQAHAVPQRAYSGRDPFDYEIIRKPEVVINEVEEEPVPVGSTAQNGFQPVRWFRCNDCGEVLRETHLDSHHCED